MLTERENALRAYRRSKDLAWVPLAEDCYQVVMPSAMKEQAEFGKDGADWFGCRWCWDPTCFGHAPDIRQKYLLEDITMWREVVKFPDLDAIDFQACAEKDLEHANREGKILRLFCEKGPFERVSALMGFEEAFASMLTESEEYQALIDAIADWKIDLFGRLIDAYRPDEMICHDDLGSAHGPLISVSCYRELIQPAHKRMVAAVHEKGVLYTHHSCGHMQEFIPCLIENGVDMINPVQYMNDWEMIEKQYADQVSFNVNLSHYANYFDAAPEQILSDVHRAIDIFAPYQNVIIESRVSNKLLPENQKRSTEEARRYGREFYSRLR